VDGVTTVLAVLREEAQASPATPTITAARKRMSVGWEHLLPGVVWLIAWVRPRRGKNIRVVRAGFLVSGAKRMLS